MNKKIITSMLLLCVVVKCTSLRSRNLTNRDKPCRYHLSYNSENSKTIGKSSLWKASKESDKVFGDQVPYGEIWSTGANEATEVKFFH